MYDKEEEVWFIQISSKLRFVFQTAEAAWKYYEELRSQDKGQE